jgi:uncharacterized protein (UPF0147 family)
MSTTSASNEPTSAGSTDGSQITHVLNRDKKYLSEHGQKLFSAINCLLDDQEQLELTQALFKYQREHNVFTLVRSCREIFDTPRKKGLMLFMRPVIPIRDRFHYDEYYKLFFPEEFSSDVRSIFSELIPQELIEKTVKKAIEKKKQNLEKQFEKEKQQKLETIKILEKANYDLNMDIQKLMSKAALSSSGGEDGGGSTQSIKSESRIKADEVLEKSKQVAPQRLILHETNVEAKLTPTLTKETPDIKNFSLDEVKNISSNTKLTNEALSKLGGFRVINLSPNENESLGFDVCMGPTGTFIMVSYVEPGSLVEQLGMQPGDELVSVNDISFKLIELEQAIEVTLNVLLRFKCIIF